MKIEEIGGEDEAVATKRNQLSAIFFLKYLRHDIFCSFWDKYEAGEVPKANHRLTPKRIKRLDRILLFFLFNLFFI